MSFAERYGFSLRVMDRATFRFSLDGERWNWPLEGESIECFGELLDRAGVDYEVTFSTNFRKVHRTTDPRAVNREAVQTIKEKGSS